MLRKLSALIPLVLSATTLVAADYDDRDDVNDFIAKLVNQHGFSEPVVREVMGQAVYQQTIIDLMTRPAEKKPWVAYRKIFVTSSRIEDGVQFAQLNGDTLSRAEAVYGVPKEYITSIIGVETNYGRNKGSHRVLDALATLGFDYPKRAPFFLSQLEDFFVLACEERVRPFDGVDACNRNVVGTALGESVEIGDLVGSYAGAMGFGQFIPTSYRRFAIDFDGDGARDIWHNVVDAIGSVAAYFQHHGWAPGQPVIIEVGVSGDLSTIDELANQRYEPTKSVAEWKALGVVTAFPHEDMLASVFRYEGSDRVRYYLGFNNFYVITRYNISHLYAKVVAEIASSVGEQL